MSDHFEPWRAHGEDWIECGDNFLLFRLADAIGDAEAAARLRRRIIACVNACAGLDTEALEAGALAKALDLLAIAHKRGVFGLAGSGSQTEATLRALGKVKP